MADLEAAALSGELFQPRRSASPARSDSSHTPLNTDDELELGLEVDSPGASKSALLPSAEKHEEDRLDGARTGPKGVMADKKYRSRLDREERDAKTAELTKAMERSAIVGQTWREEEAARATAQERDELEEWRRNRRRELEVAREAGAGRGNGTGDPSLGGLSKKGLREVGQEGFVAAVEKRGWVVVLIYEPDIPRCQPLLNSLLALSTSLSTLALPVPLTLLRARATSLSFSLLPNSDTSLDLDSDGASKRADPDVLPSLLAYRDGELEHTWIRVDWELEADGIEGLLRREGILPPAGGLAFSRDLIDMSDDEEEDDD